MDIQKELIAEFDREADRTRKILKAIPENADFNWKPSPKSMPLAALAGHIADMLGDWGLKILTQDKFEHPAGQSGKQFKPSNRAQVLEHFEKGISASRPALVATAGEKWDQHWKFIYAGRTVVDLPRYEVWRDMVVNHLIHHRAQLGVYIRVLGGKLPGTYGPSADEA